MSSGRNNSRSAKQLSKGSRPLSWIPPEICWTSVSGLIGLRISIDFDLIEFVANGTLESVLLPSGVCSNLEELKHYGGRLLNKLLIVANAQPLLRPSIEYSDDEINTVMLHLHGVFVLPCLRECLVLIGRETPCPSGGWLSERLKDEAVELCAGYHAAKDAHEKNKANKIAALPSPIREKMSALSGYFGDPDAPSQPKIDRAWLMSLCPGAVAIASRRKDWSGRLETRALSAIAQSGWPPSRDGQYEGILPLMIGSDRSALVVWEPYPGLPAYPEVRWCVQRRLPRALRKPRLTRSKCPELELDDDDDDMDMVIGGVSDNIADLFGILQDAHHDFPLEDLGGPIVAASHDRIEDVKIALVKRGFEAIAWFQPYHVWSEETWGIYIDAPKLDDFALSLLEDFRQHSIRADHLVAPIAFGLVYAHELFHAKVEAALSWIEVNAERPRHLRYKRNVYRKTFGQSECLEEALANWYSWHWFKSHQGDFVENTKSSETFDQVVENVLDMSPPGYCDWRIGHDSVSWKAFASQLATGSLRIPPRGTALPLDSILRGPFPYDFRLNDVPLRFAGRGVITNCFNSNPVTLNQPSRAEVEKALRYFKHTVDPSKGRGSHQKWTGPDRHTFTLPRRDPVSRGVFKSFLRHIGIEKKQYLINVRPHL